ncbi:hypothetical protein AAG570_011322 [Ranatra chinensis]|uniref:XPA C-terminal domain-containing protein n=1 Tax=Ranatra chinensis TaxID=642074 RepID=A0ABD0YKI4_9HEMI
MLDIQLPTCIECQKEFATSYLMQSFDYSVCDGCRDNEEKHCLITKTEAKSEYLLKDCDLDLREPPLKFILRQNPHNATWGQMKLYLLLQVEKRALEVWGSMEKLEEAHGLRKEKRIVAKTKQYNKNLKALRMVVRSSLYDQRVNNAPHEHEFGEEVYDSEEDNYTRTCLTCEFKETFEKM